MTEPILETLLQSSKASLYIHRKYPYVSNVTGTWVTAEQATDPHYWTTHLRQTVRFSDGVSDLLSEPSRVFLEVGPGRALSGFVKLHATCYNDFFFA